MLSQQLLNNIESLPPNLQKEVSDFVDFLRQKYPAQQVNLQRTVGSNRLFDQLRLVTDFSNEEVDLLFKRDSDDTGREIEL